MPSFIQNRLEDDLKADRVATEIACTLNTIRNGIKHETVTLCSSNVQPYNAIGVQASHEK